MIPVGGDSWTISTSTDPNVDFAVWVLRRDGLRAGAFDSHPDGDGRLRTAGLTAEMWIDWFEQIVRTTSKEGDAVRDDPGAIRGDHIQRPDPLQLFFGTETPSVAEINRYRASLQAQTAAGRFAGQETVRRLLLELWPDYMLRSRELAEGDFARHIVRQKALTEEEAEALASRARRFWEDLQEYRPLPPLHFYLVEYVKSVVSILPPASAVVGLVDPDEGDLEKYSSLIFEGARLLKQAS